MERYFSLLKPGVSIMHNLKIKRKINEVEYLIH